MSERSVQIKWRQWLERRDQKTREAYLSEVETELGQEARAVEEIICDQSENKIINSLENALSFLDDTTASPASIDRLSQHGFLKENFDGILTFLSPDENGLVYAGVSGHTSPPRIVAFDKYLGEVARSQSLRGAVTGLDKNDGKVYVTTAEPQVVVFDLNQLRMVQESPVGRNGNRYLNVLCMGETILVGVYDSDKKLAWHEFSEKENAISKKKSSKSKILNARRWSRDVEGNHFAVVTKNRNEESVYRFEEGFTAARSAYFEGTILAYASSPKHHLVLQMPKKGDTRLVLLGKDFKRSEDEPFKRPFSSMCFSSEGSVYASSVNAIYKFEVTPQKPKPL